MHARLQPRVPICIIMQCIFIHKLWYYCAMHLYTQLWYYCAYRVGCGRWSETMWIRVCNAPGTVLILYAVVCYCVLHASVCCGVLHASVSYSVLHASVCYEVCCSEQCSRMYILQCKYKLCMVCILQHSTRMILCANVLYRQQVINVSTNAVYAPSIWIEAKF